MPTTDRTADAESTSVLSVRLYSINDSRTADAESTSEMSVTLSHPSGTFFVTADAESTAEMSVSLSKAWAGNTPHGLIVQSPHASPTIN